jgi:hypothetical protein
MQQARRHEPGKQAEHIIPAVDQEPEADPVRERQHQHIDDAGDIHLLQPREGVLEQQHGESRCSDQRDQGDRMAEIRAGYVCAA